MERRCRRHRQQEEEPEEQEEQEEQEQDEQEEQKEQEEQGREGRQELQEQTSWSTTGASLSGPGAITCATKEMRCRVDETGWYHLFSCAVHHMQPRPPAQPEICHGRAAPRA